MRTYPTKHSSRRIGKTRHDYNCTCDGLGATEADDAFWYEMSWRLRIDAAYAALEQNDYYARYDGKERTTYQLEIHGQSIRNFHGKMYAMRARDADLDSGYYPRFYCDCSCVHCFITMLRLEGCEHLNTVLRVQR